MGGGGGGAIDDTMGLFQGVVGQYTTPWVSFRGWWGYRRYHAPSYECVGGGGVIMEAIGIRIGVGGYHKTQ